LLSADPLEDIHNTESIWRVIKGGWLFDPDKLAAQAPASKASKKRSPSITEPRRGGFHESAPSRRSFTSMSFKGGSL
jgi:hypothetical protein